MVDESQAGDRALNTDHVDTNGMIIDQALVDIEP